MKPQVTIGKTTWTKDTLYEWLRKDDAALKRALLKLYKKQSTEERNNKVTSHNNGVGFNAYDAEVLSEFAERVAKGLPLTPGELGKLRGKIKKYCNQLINIIIAEKVAKYGRVAA